MEFKKRDIHYRYDIPANVTVCIDSREQVPLLFPTMVQIAHPELNHLNIPIGVTTKVKKLDFGDYLLEEYPTICVVERKASALEIYKNMNESHDRIRQAKAFRKLATGCKYPYLLVEASPAELLSSNPHIKQPELVCHRLALAIAKYGFHALFIPWKSRSPIVRRKVGTLLIHLMLGCVLKTKFDVPPVLLEEE